MEPTNNWKYIGNVDISGCTVIIPSVAVGNVGQLACDLLISSFKMTKIASVYSPALIPVLGYDPYDLKSSSLATSCEVYHSIEKSLVVLQFRAPIVYKYAKTFLNEMIEQFKQKRVKDVIILSSSYAHEKKHILSSPFRYIATDDCPYTDALKKLKWEQHETTDGAIQILGGGFASILYSICKEKAVSCIILYKYCSEGDNIPDACDMIHQLHLLLPLFDDKTEFVSQLIQPVSWKLLFGRPPPQDIY